MTKVLLSDYIPKENFYVSVYEDELIKEADQLGVNIFKRSYESANNDNTLKKIYEWHDKLPFKYVVSLSACNPLLTIETIDKFVQSYLESDKEVEMRHHFQQLMHRIKVKLNDTELYNELTLLTGHPNEKYQDNVLCVQYESEQEEENTDPSFFYFHCEKLKMFF